jgi:hypothetical protein
VCLANRLDKSSIDLRSARRRRTPELAGSVLAKRRERNVLGGISPPDATRSARKLRRTFAPTTGTDAPAPGADPRNPAIVTASTSRGRDGGGNVFKLTNMFFIR